MLQKYNGANDIEQKMFKYLLRCVLGFVLRFPFFHVLTFCFLRFFYVLSGAGPKSGYSTKHSAIIIILASEQACFTFSCSTTGIFTRECGPGLLTTLLIDLVFSFVFCFNVVGSSSVSKKWRKLSLTTARTIMEAVSGPSTRRNNYAKANFSM